MRKQESKGESGKSYINQEKRMFLIRKMLNVFLNTIRKNALILLNFDLG